MSAFANAAAQASGQNTSAPSGDPLITTPAEGADPLFSGGQSLPSLFTKEHDAGAVRTGVISKVPYDRQSRFLDEDENGRPIAGDLKWWGEDNKPSKDAAGPNGAARQPVMDTIVPLTTSYAGEKGPEDGGERAWYVGGAPAMNALKAAIAELKLTSREQMVGLTITIERLPKIKRAWQYKVTLSR